MQEGLGLSSITDGEYRRMAWHMDFLYAIGASRRSRRPSPSNSTTPNDDVSFTPASVREPACGEGSILTRGYNA